MTNNGKFDCHVEWELKSQPPPVTPPVAAKSGKAPPKSSKDAAKDTAAAAAASPIFLFEPKVQVVIEPAQLIAPIQHILCTSNEGICCQRPMQQLCVDTDPLQ